MEVSSLGYRLAGIGALAGGLAVAAGAFGAHALRDLVTPERLVTFETAARYLMYHALALAGVGMLLTTGVGALRLASGLRLAGWLFLLGMMLFPGSLFALVLLDRPALGMITPFGGVAFIAGWIILGVTLLRR